MVVKSDIELKNYQSVQKRHINNKFENFIRSNHVLVAITATGNDPKNCIKNVKQTTLCGLYELIGSPSNEIFLLSFSTDL